MKTLKKKSGREWIWISNEWRFDDRMKIYCLRSSEIRRFSLFTSKGSLLFDSSNINLRSLKITASYSITNCLMPFRRYTSVFQEFNKWWVRLFNLIITVINCNKNFLISCILLRKILTWKNGTNSPKLSEFQAFKGSWKNSFTEIKLQPNRILPKFQK